MEKIAHRALGTKGLSVSAIGLGCMSLSGVYLWLASRPRYRPAQLVFALGSGVFILLYAVTR